MASSPNVQASSPVPAAAARSSPVAAPAWDSAAVMPIDLPLVFGSPTPTQTPTQKSLSQSPERSSQSHAPLTPPLTPASLPPSTDLSASHFASHQSPFATSPARGSAAPPSTPSSTGLRSFPRQAPSFSHGDSFPPSPVAISSGLWPSSSSSPLSSSRSNNISRFNHRSSTSSSSPISSNSEPSIDLSDPRPLEPDRLSGLPPLGGLVAERDALELASELVFHHHSGASARFLLIGHVPCDASMQTLKDAFYSLGDIKAICVRFQQSKGIIILAFYDSRHAALAEHQIASQTFFGNIRLYSKAMPSASIKKLMGESSFVDEARGEVLITVEEGKMDSKFLASVLSSFGDLHSLNQADIPDSQSYIAEFCDSRKARSAINSLHGRNMFNARLRLVLLGSCLNNETSIVPFPQEANSRHGFPSQPSTPHTSALTLHADSQPLPYSYQDSSTFTSDMDRPELDTTNSSPFHGNRSLPSVPLHSGNSRRISTGSVNVSSLGMQLHQSTSEQDLRRRAAAAAAAAAVVANNSAVTQMTNCADLTAEHTRRTSDTFCFDALRKASGQIGAMRADSSGNGGCRQRARAISDSSASPRVVSPSDDVHIQSFEGHPNLSVATPETNNMQMFDRDLFNDSPQFTRGHVRMSTASDSSQEGGPHTPPPSNGTMSAYGTPYYHPPVDVMHSPHGHTYMAHPASVLGIPVTPTNSGLLAPQHGQYYMNSSSVTSMASPMSIALGIAATSPQAVGAYPFGMGYNMSPNGMNISSSTASSALRLSHGSPARSTSSNLRSPVRGATDATRDGPPERNQIDLDKIAAGLDTRTTVMIKNIPNKLSDQDLIEYINRVCPRKIDFLYLRMDFQNGCNVGYAFVNFIHVQDLLLFARTKLGVKWNMFSSEKVLQMSYANYQGKEALVEKFKNSCVMDEREAWRPKIFYSSGPNQGLPEPFPSPTHFRRKERSAQNRGALFVPSSAHGPGSGVAGSMNSGSTVGHDGNTTALLHAPFRRNDTQATRVGRT